MLQWNYEHKTFDNSNTKLLPDLNADPRSNTQNLKPKIENPKTQISDLMLQWNYEHKTFDTRTTKLLPHFNGDPRSKT